MAATAAIIGYGTTLSYDAYPTPTSATLVANVVDLPTEPGVMVPGADATNNDSPSAAKEQVPALVEQEKPSFVLIWNKTAFNTLWGFATGRTLKTWKITKPDASNFTFPGWISKIGGKYKLQDTLVFDVEITQNFGVPTFATT